MKLKISIIIVLASLIVLLGALYTLKNSPKENKEQPTDPFTALLQNPSTESLPKIGEYILAQFQNQTPENLSRIITSNGVLFAPYVHIEPNNRVIGQNGMSQLFTDPNTYTWGTQDGSGEPIIQTGSDYISKRVTSKTYMSVTPTVNPPIGHGNMIANVLETFPNSAQLEYYIPPTEEGGMNWSSLIFVFEYRINQWFLVGVVNDGWTI